MEKKLSKNIDFSTVENEGDSDSLDNAISYCCNLLNASCMVLTYLNKLKIAREEKYKNTVLFKPSIPSPKFFCCICNEGCNENPSTIMGCGHEYHVECIKQWNKINSECPLCRKVLGPRKMLLKIE